jgi:hypothetical protein
VCAGQRETGAEMVEAGLRRGTATGKAAISNPTNSAISAAYRLANKWAPFSSYRSEPRSLCAATCNQCENEKGNCRQSLDRPIESVRRLKE